MENVKFSIIIAAYNIENYIERSIKSVLSQSYKNYELIVVDDYSTDNTRSKIEKYKDDIIFIKHKKNTFLGGTRNTGIEAAKGKYILFLDGDDFLYDDNVLEKLDNLIGDKTVDVIYDGSSSSVLIKNIAKDNSTWEVIGNAPSPDTINHSVRYPIIDISRDGLIERISINYPSDKPLPDLNKDDFFEQSLLNAREIAKELEVTPHGEEEG